MAEIDTSDEACAVICMLVSNPQGALRKDGDGWQRRVNDLIRALRDERHKLATETIMVRVAVDAVKAERDTALARAEKAELVNECHCVNVEALTTERDTAEAQLTTALARVAELDADRTLVKGRLQHSEYMNGIRVQQAKADADNIAKLQAQLTTALARVAELEGENEWRPIESAPKDGTPVELWRDKPSIGHWQSCVVAMWCKPYVDDDELAWVWPDDAMIDIFDEDRTWFDEGNFYSSDTSFTHWRPVRRPLPTPPRKET